MDHCMLTIIITALSLRYRGTAKQMPRFLRLYSEDGVLNPPDCRSIVQFVEMMARAGHLLKAGTQQRLVLVGELCNEQIALLFLCDYAS